MRAAVAVAIFTSVGLAAVFSLLTQRIPYRYVAVGVFAALTIASGAMLRDALRNGPTWYENYGLYGMQFGASQVFDHAAEYLEGCPEARLVLSPSWVNGADVLKRFLMPDEERVSIDGVNSYELNKLTFPPGLVFIMTPEEYDEYLGNPKFTDIDVVDAVEYPDGRNGFYFVRLSYSPEADAIFALEIAEPRRPVEEDVSIDGETVATSHSRFDAGQLAHLFDGDSFTLARTMEANPAVIELSFPEPRPLAGLTITTGIMDIEQTVTVFPEDDAEPTPYFQIYTDLPDDPTVDLDFAPTRSPASRIRIAVRDINLGERDHIHVREIVFRCSASYLAEQPPYTPA